MLTVLEEDFARLPGLLGATAELAAEPEPELVATAAPEPAVQLDLF